MAQSIYRVEPVKDYDSKLRMFALYQKAGSKKGDYIGRVFEVSQPKDKSKKDGPKVIRWTFDQKGINTKVPANTVGNHLRRIDALESFRNETGIEPVVEAPEVGVEVSGSSQAEVEHIDFGAEVGV